MTPCDLHQKHLAMKVAVTPATLRCEIPTFDQKCGGSEMFIWSFVWA